MRRIKLIILVCAVALMGTACSEESAPEKATTARKMIVLGVDGMDPELLQELLALGEMPNTQNLIASGGFRVLGTSNPPQSPVAWSNFITGLNPGGHGLFDFLALDRKTLRPYLSSSAVIPAKVKPLEVGDWRVPLQSDQTVLLRKGIAFWELLEMAGVDVTLVRMPANYPPVATSGNSLSGMGTPDLRGTSGTFMFFSTRRDLNAGPVSGGDLVRFERSGETLVAHIAGPANPLRAESPPLSATLEVLPDLKNDRALVRTADMQIVVTVGEWTEWVQLEFELFGGLVKVPGMVRLYLQSIQPDTKLYVSPVNIDPRAPVQQISSPETYASELAEALGPFYTEEMPEDAKALSAHVLTAGEYLDQTEIVFQESRRLLEFELSRFVKKRAPAFLFYYFSTLDQRHHMMGRQIDPQHPAFSIGAENRVRDSMRSTYHEIDKLLGAVRARIGNDTAVVVMSDHGFSRFYRQAHLNAWLKKSGYLVLKRNVTPGTEEWLPEIDWARTRAFSIGLNSLYINVRGRERFGIVPEEERLELAQEIADRLRTWADDASGLPVVTRPSLREEIYRGPYLGDAPDIVVGYGDGFRGSWATSKGQTADTLIEDNLDEWSADHCVDPAIAAGVLISSLLPKTASPQLIDLPVGILDYFAVERGPGMRGIAPF